MDFRDDLQRQHVLPMVMGALLLVLLPLFRFVPWWVSVFSVVALLVAWFVRRALPAYIRLILVIAATAAVILQHRALFSREAGLSLIVLMISFKLLETRKYRDVMLILAMMFFLIFTGFLLAQDLANSLYLTLCVPLVLAAVLQINLHRTSVSSTAAFRGVGRLMLLALPMMIAFYLFFPRLSVPLWILPGSGQGGTTGFSEELNFGDVSSLALNDELAFRVEFDDAIPPEDQRYWRTVMLTEFDGYTWRLANEGFRKEALTSQHVDYRYLITMQPHRGRWLPVLDVPVSIPKNYTLVGGRMIWLGYELRRVVAYHAESQVAATFGVALSDEERRLFLQLPAVGNQQSKQLGARLRTQLADNEKIANYLTRQINQDAFFYTLTPPELANDLIDDFWFNQKRGFCEHYAASAAFILRAAGVPSRIIGGYQGGKLNPFGRYLTILQSDAHAWVEYWHEQRGWVRLDPTAAIAPFRIEPDLRQRLRNRDGVIEPSQWASEAFAADTPDLLQSLHEGWQLANEWFESHIVQFNKENQRDWLQSLGMENVDRTVLVQMLVAFVFAGLFGAGWWLLRPRRANDPLLRCYERFEQRMKKHGVERANGEPPLMYFSRCQHTNVPSSHTISLFARYYLDMRFGRAEPNIALLRKLLHQIH